MDHEILLHFIDGPGAGLTLMVLGFFVLILGLAIVRARMKDSYNEGRASARRESLDHLQASIARLIHDQQEIKNRLDYDRGAIVPGE
jgi:hypothetical protein